ncbi:hypothetical protein Droror1_Dr00009865 [Drosera rotundifolia]
MKLSKVLLARRLAARASIEQSRKQKPREACLSMIEPASRQRKNAAMSGERVPVESSRKRKRVGAESVESEKSVSTRYAKRWKSSRTVLLMKLSKLLLLWPLADRAYGQRKHATISKYLAHVEPSWEHNQTESWLPIAELVSRQRKNVAASAEMVQVESSRKQKQEGAESVSSSYAKRRKPNRTVKRVEETDRDFTDLPEQVIHRILSLLCLDEAARLCVLSKRWNSMWNSLPVLGFDERHFKKQGDTWEMNMLSVVVRSLQSRLQQNLTIEKFRLSVPSARFFQVFMHDIIATAIDLKVKILEVIVKPVGLRNFFIVPSTVLSASSIVVLNLFWCEVDTYDSDCVNLPKLRKLALKMVTICEKMLQKLITGCPSLQYLKIVECSGLKDIVISTARWLKRMEVYQCHDLKSMVISTAPLLKHIKVYKCLDLKRINVNAPTLKSFHFNAKMRKHCDLKMSACRSLKELVLEYPRMSDQMFEQLIVQFPNLEKLSLLNCFTIQNIHIPCEKLRYLVIMKCSRLVEAVIHPSRLFSLEYMGSGMPISLLNPTSLEEVKFFVKLFPRGRMGCPDQGRSDEKKLKDLLQNLDPSKGLKMISRDDLGLILQEAIVGKPHISDSISGLQLQISRSVGQLIDNFLRYPRGAEYLNVVSPVGSDFPEVVKQRLEREMQDPRCCSSRSLNKRCWRHYLKSIVPRPLGRVDSWTCEDNFEKESGVPPHKETLLELTWERGYNYGKG